MNIENIKKLMKYSPDLKIRTIKNINIIFFESLCNSNDINDFILRPITINNINSIDKIKDIIPFSNIKEINNEKDLFYLLYSGFTIINIDNNFIAFETKYHLDSGIIEATNEKVIKGPKDAFSENYQNNLGLIRKRIRSNKLKIIEHIIGTESKTKVAIIYMDNIAGKIDDDMYKRVSDKIRDELSCNVKKLNDLDKMIDKCLIVDNSKYDGIFFDFLKLLNPTRDIMISLINKI